MSALYRCKSGWSYHLPDAGSSRQPTVRAAKANVGRNVARHFSPHNGGHFIFMNTQHIEKKFTAMGAVLRHVTPHNFASNAHRLDIKRSSGKSYFELATAKETDDLEVIVVNSDAKNRHLLLGVRSTVRYKTNRGAFVDEKIFDRYLCGHDERDWFVAAIPGGASTVKQAMQALQPPAVRSALQKNGLREKNKLKRRNEAFKRQGEWFFIPDGIEIDPAWILKDEPLQRGRNKPHMAEELVRMGGTEVIIAINGPANGYTQKEWEAAGHPRVIRRMVRDAAVYVRGAIRHTDHATLMLKGWHRVEMNTENKSRAMANVAFLD